MKLSRLTLIWLGLMIFLIMLEVGQLAGFVRLDRIINNPWGFVFGITLIAILAVVGALFVGVFIAYRVYTSKGFTPYEEEILRVADEVHKISARTEKIEKELHEIKEGLKK
ncbi:MAG: hypothetical protein N3F63_05170 [Thermoplasmata archaeon]|nr:hypothetical protein [Thermoplasmata archaeon]